MKSRILFATCLLSLQLVSRAAPAAPVGTAFTYQGQLVKGGVVHTGTADFTFRLYDAVTSGAQVGADVSVAGATVTGGLFTVSLDFGAVFTGTALWLEIQAKTPGDAGFTTLTPRQPLTATPFAMYAMNGGGGGAGPWVTGANGISYPGNVGIGQAASPTVRLYVDTGTADVNPIYATSNNATYGTLVVRNFGGTNSYGLYDDTSGRHYLKGRLGINTLTPAFPFDVSGAGRFSHTGSAFDGAGTYSSALWVHGYTGGNIGGRASNGVTAGSTDGRGVYGISQTNWGVAGECLDGGTYGVLGSPGTAVYGHANSGSKYAGHFVNEAANSVALRADGIAEVKKLRILGGADLAERFDVHSADAAAAPGTVMMIDATAPGRLAICDEAHSRRVAGVVSGARALDAGVVLSADGQIEGTVAVALTGRVWVQCDATAAPIRPGDLLTTAARRGHAMRVDDPELAHGAILGKAMSSLESGTGMVLVLVTLQ